MNSTCKISNNKLFVHYIQNPFCYVIRIHLYSLTEITKKFFYCLMANRIVNLCKY